jgi:HIUase/Transthyretin family
MTVFSNHLAVNKYGLIRKRACMRCHGVVWHVLLCSPVDRTGFQAQKLLHAAEDTGRSPITCHVLDTTLGKPATELPVTLSRLAEGSKCALTHCSLLCFGMSWLTSLPRGSCNVRKRML